MTSICQSAIVCKSLRQHAVPQRARVHVCAVKQRLLGTVPAGENPYKVDSNLIKVRGKLLQRYLKDDQKELQALYALQALMVQMEQPASECRRLGRGRTGHTPTRADAGSLSPLDLLRVFFDTLYDEDVIKEEAFYKWESSKDPAEQLGKGVALKSVTAFFTWLREAEDESDNS